MHHVKPRRLRSGDTVAVLSTSWGGPHAFPHVFDTGLSVLLTDRFGLRVKELPTTRLSVLALAAGGHSASGRSLDYDRNLWRPGLRLGFATGTTTPKGRVRRPRREDDEDRVSSLRHRNVDGGTHSTSW